jgi:hypothetical protein
VPPSNSSSSRRAVCWRSCTFWRQAVMARLRSSQAVCHIRVTSGAHANNTSTNNLNRKPEKSWAAKALRLRIPPDYHIEPVNKKTISRRSRGIEEGPGRDGNKGSGLAGCG